MRQKKFCRVPAFFFGEEAHAKIGCKQGSANAEHIAAFDAVKPHRLCEADSIHPEGVGKVAHFGKQIVYAVHLP